MVLCSEAHGGTCKYYHLSLLLWTASMSRICISIAPCRLRSTRLRSASQRAGHAQGMRFCRVRTTLRELACIHTWNVQ